MKRIKVVSPQQSRVKVVDRAQRKLDHESVARALGAQIVTEMPARSGYFGALELLGRVRGLKRVFPEYIQHNEHEPDER